MTSFKALIPLDGSEFSQQVLKTVLRLLNPKDYVLTLLRVASPPEGATGVPPRAVIFDGWSKLVYDSERDIELAEHPVYASQIWEGFRAELKDEMSEDLKELKEAGFLVLLAVRFGDDAAQEIADYVEEEEIDLVVMATHGRRGLSRALMGSVAEKVLRSVRVPVMMVRPVLEAAAEPLLLTNLVERGQR